MKSYEFISKLWWVVFLKSIFFILIVNSAYGEEKIALVIGNQSYRDSPLKYPANDAVEVAKKLKELGFKVNLLINKSSQEMKLALDNHLDLTKKINTVGLVYYAGHGVQLRDRNLALGVDASIEKDLRERSVNIQEFIAKSDKSNTTNIVILDACREYLPPNKENLTNSEAKNGLRTLATPSGTLVAFSTSPGTVSYDGDDKSKHGIYTKHLLKYLNTPGMPVEKIFKKVRQGVQDETNGKQIPMEISLLTRDFYFNPSNASNKNITKSESYNDQDNTSDGTLTDLYSILNRIKENGNNLIGIRKDSSIIDLGEKANGVFEKLIGIRFSVGELIDISNNLTTVNATFIETPEITKMYYKIRHPTIMTYKVATNGVAFNAGLREGDIIVSINGNNIYTENSISPGQDFQKITEKLSPGEIVTARVLREGKEIELSSTVERSSIEDLLIAAANFNINKKDFERALNVLIPIAIKGNPTANAMIAVNILNKNFKTNYKYEDEFAKFAFAAYQNGESFGASLLSIAYANGYGVEKNPEISIQLKQNFANAGHSWAEAGLGISYIYGYGVKKDFALAREYLLKAALKANFDGMFGLGLIYENGLGVPQDDEIAIGWYENAFKYGNETIKNISKNKIQKIKSKNSVGVEKIFGSTSNFLNSANTLFDTINSIGEIIKPLTGKK